MLYKSMPLLNPDYTVVQSTQQVFILRPEPMGPRLLNRSPGEGTTKGDFICILHGFEGTTFKSRVESTANFFNKHILSL